MVSLRCVYIDAETLLDVIRNVPPTSFQNRSIINDVIYIYIPFGRKNEFNNFAHTLIEQCQHDVESCDKAYQKCLNTLPEQKSLGGSVDKLHTHGKRYARRNAEM
jgi:hypothetical protein